MDVAAAELLGGHGLPGRRLHERRAAEEDRPLPLHDDDLVGHRRDVGAARRAGAEDRRDLRDSLGRHPGLVVEDPAEVVAVGEDLRLEREERTARVDEVDAREAVLEGDLLRAEVLLHRDREVGPSLHGRVVRDDHDVAPRDAADAGDDARSRRLAVEHPVGGKGRELEKGGALVEEALDASADGELPELGLAGRSLRTAPLARGRDPFAELTGERLVVGTVLTVVLGRGFDPADENVAHRAILAAASAATGSTGPGRRRAPRSPPGPGVSAAPPPRAAGPGPGPCR